MIPTIRSRRAPALVLLAATSVLATLLLSSVSFEAQASSCGAGVSSGRLSIPSLCVSAPVTRSVDRAGLVTIPANVHEVGWFAGSARPTATRGNTVIVGHLNYYNQGDGALAHLGSVAVGAHITLSLPGRPLTHWRVVSKFITPKGHLTEKLFTTTGPRYLDIITCAGALHHYANGWHYTDNLVVRAVPLR
jgi:sortase (surface protein transpeptidase)